MTPISIVDLASIMIHTSYIILYDDHSISTPKSIELIPLNGEVQTNFLLVSLSLVHYIKIVAVVVVVVNVMNLNYFKSNQIKLQQYKGRNINGVNDTDRRGSIDGFCILDIVGNELDSLFIGFPLRGRRG